MKNDFLFEIEKNFIKGFYIDLNYKEDDFYVA